MADKKSSKADKKRKSRSNMAYIAGGRRQVNAIRRLKRHTKRHPNDAGAASFLEFHRTSVASDYKRGAVGVQAAHKKALAAAGLEASRRRHLNAQLAEVV